MKLSWKREMLPVVLFLAMVAAAVYYYHLLPASVPSRFGTNGKPNGWMSKPGFLSFNLGMFIFLYILTTFLPFIDPFKKKIAPRFGVVLVFRDAVLLFITVMFLVSIRAALIGSLNIDIPQLLVGLVIAVFGNFMPKMPQNWFFGIRTPWALSSEIVWKKTNILGGWLMTLAGVIWIICAVLKLYFWIPVGFLVVVVVWVYVYSFLVYKQLERSGKLNGPKS